jgi:hypothetical protein
VLKCTSFVGLHQTIHVVNNHLPIQKNSNLSHLTLNNYTIRHSIDPLPFNNYHRLKLNLSLKLGIKNVIKVRQANFLLYIFFESPFICKLYMYI